MSDLLRDPLKSPLLNARVAIKPGTELAAMGHRTGRIIQAGVRVLDEIERTEQHTGEPETGLREWLAERGAGQHFVAVEVDDAPGPDKAFLAVIEDLELIP